MFFISINNRLDYAMPGCSSNKHTCYDILQYLMFFIFVWRFVDVKVEFVFACESTCVCESKSVIGKISTHIDSLLKFKIVKKGIYNII